MQDCVSEQPNAMCLASQSRGWHNPDEESEDEDVQEIAADGSFPAPLVVPCKLRQPLSLRFTASSDSIKKVSETLMLSTREHPRKLHMLLMVDHLSAQDSASLSAAGQQAVTDLLFQRGDLSLMGVIFSHHAGTWSELTVEEVIREK